MVSLLLPVIYLAFISLGLPDALLGLSLIHIFARGQQHTAEQQRRQPGGGERLFLIRAERRVHQQRREHKAQPQQRRVPAEAGRQVQRHGQQRGHGKDPLAERRGLDRQRRQRRKEQQICKPPQKQRGRKAKMQHIGQKYCRRTDDVQKLSLILI